MIQRVFLCLVSLILTLNAQAALKPAMSAGGKTTFGSKSIWIKSGYLQIEMIVGETTSLFGTSLFDFGKGLVSPCFFINKKMKKEPNRITWTSDIVGKRGLKKVLGHYSISLTLQKNNLVLLSCKYKLLPGVKTQKSYFYLACLGNQPLSGFYNIGKQKTELNPQKYVQLDAAPDMSLTFFPDKADKKFKLIPKVYSGPVEVNAKAGRISFTPREGKIELLLDMSGEKRITRSKEYYGGVDFGKIDRLHLPRYKRCRNLIQNPSFESGLRYWGHKTFGSAFQPENFDVYNIDNEDAKFGMSSLRIKATKSLSLPLATFAVPVTPGKKYILSFYAKGNLPEGLMLRLNGRATVTWWMFKNKRAQILKLTDKWQRYSVSFTPREEFYSVYFQAMLDPRSKEKSGFIWLDGLQLEKDKLTEYTEKPFNLQLLSSARGNFLKFQQKPDFKLIVKVKPKQSGSVTISTEDFFFKKVFHRTYKFTADKNGKAVINLSELDNKILSSRRRGVFMTKAILTLNGDKSSYRDYFRFSVMNPLENKHKNKDIFCVTFSRVGNFLCTDGLDRRLARLRDIGFGSTLRIEIKNRDTEKRLYKKIKEYGLADMGCRVFNKWTKGGIIQEDNMQISNLRECMVNPSPELLKKYEAICAAKARNRPWISTWYFPGEIEGMKPLVNHPESLGKLVVASLKGIKKGNPKAKMQMGGAPWNIEANGRKWYEEYLKAVIEADPKAKFDGTSIHIYRQMPEAPDLDAAAATFIKILTRYGYGDKPIYWDEGMNYFEYFIPLKGMTPYYGNSGDKWYPGMLTYDMGRAERIAAAFSARSWLVALKYRKNIACLLDFSMRRYFWDMDLTVGAKMKVVNTLGRILGNANFYKDIRFAPNCRCYMFIDEKKRPVAAVWGYDIAVDKWEKAPPVFKFNFAGQKLEFMDLMETQRKFPVKNGYTQISVGSFPLFIIGQPGAEKLLAQSIANGKKLAGSLAPVKVSAMPLNAKQAQIRFSNTLTLPLQAEANVALNGFAAKYPLDLKDQGTLTKLVRLPSSASMLTEFSFSAAVKAKKYLNKQVKINGSFAFLPTVRNITVDGKADDWKNIPEIKLGPQSSVKLAVCKNTLYIAIQTPLAVSSPLLLFDAAPTLENWADFKTKEQDIFVYEIQKIHGVLTAFTHYVPWVQADSGSWSPKAGRQSRFISGKISQIKVGKFFEIAIKPDGIMPQKLKQGDKLGINIILKKGGTVMSLAPVKDYRNAKAPGKFKLILSFIK